MVRYSEAEATAPDFLDRLNAALQAVRPFVDYMSNVLITNAEGGAFTLRIILTLICG